MHAPKIVERLLKISAAAGRCHELAVLIWLHAEDDKTVIERLG